MNGRLLTNAYFAPVIDYFQIELPNSSSEPSGIYRMNSGGNHAPHQWCLDCSPLETIRKSTSDPKSFPVSPLFISRGNNFHGRGAG